MDWILANPNQAAQISMAAASVFMLVFMSRRAWIVLAIIVIGFFLLAPAVKPAAMASEPLVGIGAKFALWPAEYDELVFWAGFWFVAILTAVIGWGSRIEQSPRVVVQQADGKQRVEGGHVKIDHESIRLTFLMLALCLLYAIAAAETLGTI